MHYRLTNALDGPLSPLDTARAIQTKPTVLRKEPQNPKKKKLKLKP